MLATKLSANIKQNLLNFLHLITFLFTNELARTIV